MSVVLLLNSLRAHHGTRQPEQSARPAQRRRPLRWPRSQRNLWSPRYHRLGWHFLPHAGSSGATGILNWASIRLTSLAPCRQPRSARSLSSRCPHARKLPRLSASTPRGAMVATPQPWRQPVKQAPRVGDSGGRHDRNDLTSRSGSRVRPVQLLFPPGTVYRNQCAVSKSRTDPGNTCTSLPCRTRRSSVRNCTAAASGSTSRARSTRNSLCSPSPAAPGRTRHGHCRPARRLIVSRPQVHEPVHQCDQQRAAHDVAEGGDRDVLRQPEQVTGTRDGATGKQADRDQVHVGDAVFEA